MIDQPRAVEKDKESNNGRASIQGAAQKRDVNEVEDYNFKVSKQNPQLGQAQEEQMSQDDDESFEESAEEEFEEEIEDDQDGSFEK